jgi:hypothetical protein
MSDEASTDAIQEIAGMGEFKKENYSRVQAQRLAMGATEEEALTRRKVRLDACRTSVEKSGGRPEVPGLGWKGGKKAPGMRLTTTHVTLREECGRFQRQGGDKTTTERPTPRPDGKPTAWSSI